jgi:AraC-like DNA-binding protein
MSAGFMLNVRAVDSPTQYALVTESIFNNHDIADFLVDKLFAGLVQLKRQISEVDLSPVQVELMRAPRGDYHDHQQHYRCPVRFNCTHNRLVFDPKALNWPIPSADVLSLRTCERLLNQETRSVQAGSAFAQAVRRAIALTLPLTPTTTQLASMLHLSERSLRRKLAQEKLSFRALLDEGRRTRALDLVTHGQRSIADVAAESGFGDPRAFRRAFRRWTGESPTAWPLESKAQVEDGNGSADGT